MEELLLCVVRRYMQSLLASYGLYTYTALKDSSCFRLIDLLPGEKDTVPRYTIRQMQLEGSIEYEALSYVWGKEEAEMATLCNGTIIFVTQNLYEAMLNIRSKTDVKTLWIDAICINQQNVIERNEQVRVMDKIYRSATKVLIWIGDEDEKTSYVFEILRMLGDFTFSEKVNDWSGVLALRKYFCLISKSGLWDAIGKVFQSEWFERVWIIQELVSHANESYRH